MDEIDGLDGRLRVAGERWRASLPPAPAINAALLARRRDAGRRVWPFAALVTAAVVVVVVAAALSLPPDRRLGAGAPPATTAIQTASTPASALAPTAGASGVPDGCDVTRPTADFVPTGAYPRTPPPSYASEWLGSAALWTMIRRDGETWADLPVGSAGRIQKTFWWSAEWSPEIEPKPAITVSGTRLDGPGSFTAGPGTNASGDTGTSMLVGVEIPTPGCWKISGQYRGAEVSYVVWVPGD